MCLSYIQSKMPGCVPRKYKKYLVRPSPPYSAQQCQYQVLTGNDGNLYKSTSNYRGIHTWKLVRGYAKTTDPRVRIYSRRKRIRSGRKKNSRRKRKISKKISRKISRRKRKISRKISRRKRKISRRKRSRSRK